MAISVLENPQDSGIQHCNNSDSDVDSVRKYSKRKKRSFNHRKKPSRLYVYMRTRFDFSSVSFGCIGVILTVLTVHRMLSVYMTHRKWINAPITYMERPCPEPPYQTLTKTTTSNARICMTTLTDSKSPSLLQRFVRWRNFDGILELTWKNKLDYATKHGYHIFDASHLVDTSRPPAWTKIRAVQALLAPQQNCDWVLWTDADTIIMNSDIAIESFLPSDNTHDLLVGSDNGGGYNSGVFLFRNTEWTRQFLDDWWNMNDYVRPPGFSLSGDNNALKALLRELPQFHQHVLSPARCTFNSFAKFLTLSESKTAMDQLPAQDWYLSENYYHKGDFIAHTPGYDNKAETLRLLLQEAE